MRERLTAFFFVSIIFLSGCHSQKNLGESSSAQPTIMIVHGAWGGGWAFREVEDLLRAEGYRVYRPTLTGQGERVHLASKEVGLETHINDVVNTILFEELNDIILVGHSYGGMVVTGVADRVPEQIDHMIYLDAMVPYDGESVMNNATRKAPPHWQQNIKDGFIIPVWVKPDKQPPKDVPHQLKTFTDEIELKNPDRLNIRTDYILTVEPKKQPSEDGFYAHSQRAEKYGWPVHILQANHNPQWTQPKELVDMLVKISRQPQ